MLLAYFDDDVDGVTRAVLFSRLREMTENRATLRGVSCVPLRSSWAALLASFHPLSAPRFYLVVPGPS